jgi:hypothetical protein
VDPGDGRFWVPGDAVASFSKDVCPIGTGGFGDVAIGGDLGPEGFLWGWEVFLLNINIGNGSGTGIAMVEMVLGGFAI